MMWLFVVAQVGREVNGYESGVGFILEYPEGMPRSERDRRALQVEQMERVLQEFFKEHADGESREPEPISVEEDIVLYLQMHGRKVVTKTDPREIDMRAVEKISEDIQAEVGFTSNIEGVLEALKVYTEPAPAEAVRAGLAVSSRNSWCIAILNVVAAFLKTQVIQILYVKLSKVTGEDSIGWPCGAVEGQRESKLFYKTLGKRCGRKEIEKAPKATSGYYTGEKNLVSDDEGDDKERVEYDVCYLLQADNLHSKPGDWNEEECRMDSAVASENSAILCLFWL
ncbi:unnamed protein product [Symbiodinium sp. KB8]|nr:unnamed protein product [Symbiodinium sp. KB8]